MYIMASPKWTVASARQNLSSVIASAAREPQRIYRRNKLVAGLVAPSALPKEPGPTLAEQFRELQQICAEENYEFPPIDRNDRPIAAARTPAQKKRKR